MGRNHELSFAGFSSWKRPWVFAILATVTLCYADSTYPDWEPRLVDGSSFDGSRIDQPGSMVDGPSMDGASVEPSPLMAPIVLMEPLMGASSRSLQSIPGAGDVQEAIAELSNAGVTAMMETISQFFQVLLNITQTIPQGVINTLQEAGNGFLRSLEPMTPEVFKQMAQDAQKGNNNLANAFMGALNDSLAQMDQVIQGLINEAKQMNLKPTTTTTTTRTVEIAQHVEVRTSVTVDGRQSTRVQPLSDTVRKVSEAEGNAILQAEKDTPQLNLS